MHAPLKQPRSHTRTALILSLALSAVACGAPDAIDQITEAELRADLFALAGDETRGREGGTLDELDASMWLADRAREAGLEPAGDNGTYFQYFPVERYRVSESSRVMLGGTDLALGSQVVPATTVLARVDAPVTVITTEQIGADPAAAGRLAAGVRGRVMVTRYSPTAGAEISLLQFGRGLLQMAGDAAEAIVVIVPTDQQDQWARTTYRFSRGSYGLDPEHEGYVRRAEEGIPLLYVREDALAAPLVTGDRLDAWIFTESFEYPSVNIVAKVPGTDPLLADEYVLFSAHQDHDGVRYPVDGDSIWNGADDNATTSVALLAIGRAFAQQPGRRSALFIWHGAEERGLMGSRWYAVNPTVPQGSIVAALNGDMMGRNHPDTAALLGAVGPHRNSPELVEMALQANTQVSGFVVDHSWDDPQHREGWYYRSDHLPYARTGVPALFFTTLLHDDYHTPFDNPDRIDITKLHQMTRWMYQTGRNVAEADAAPALDPDFELERCRDYTGDYCN